LENLELEHLLVLLEMRQQAEHILGVYAEKLEDFVLKCRESGASARGMAEALGVSPTSIQTWTVNARRRRDDAETR
jgi:hypothetical protein